MVRDASTGSGRDRALAMFADWTDRIAAGEVPPAPPRPQGLERNVVITEWDWADPKAYLHDEVSTDRRNPDAQCQRPDLRIARAERGLSAGARSGGATRIGQVKLTVRDPNTPPTAALMIQPSPYWGSEADLDEQEQRAQPDVRREGTRLDHVRGPAAPTIRTTARPDRTIRRRSCFRSQRSGRQLAMYDPKTRQDHAHQHVLRHASPDVRRGRQPHAVDERRRPGRRLAEHEDVRRDRRRGEVAGMDGAHHGHQRQRQARRRTSSPTSQSIRRRTNDSAPRSMRWRPRLTDRSGVRCSASRARSSGSIPDRIRPRPRWRKSTSRRSTIRKRRCTAFRRAAWTSIATASRGPRSRAATWRASIAANARDRSTVRPRPVSIVPRAGRSTPSRCRR